MLRHLLRVAVRNVDTRPDGGGSHVHGVEALLRLTQVRDLALERRGPRVEFLADRHRHGVLELGAPHLDDVDELIALGAE